MTASVGDSPAATVISETALARSGHLADAEKGEDHRSHLYPPPLFFSFDVGIAGAAIC